MRSHNWVVQGCAGEGSGGHGAALMPTAPVVLGWSFLGLSAEKALCPGHACPLCPAGGIPSHPQTRALSLSCCLLLRKEKHAALSPPPSPGPKHQLPTPGDPCPRAQPSSERRAGRTGRLLCPCVSLASSRAAAARWAGA